MTAVRGFRAPPSGPPEELSNWDGPIEQACLLFIDLEMTGLQPEQDRVIELCAELVRGDQVLARIDLRAQQIELERRMARAYLRVVIGPAMMAFGEQHDRFDVARR